MTYVNGLFFPLCDAVVFPVLAKQANQRLLTVTLVSKKSLPLLTSVV